MILVPVKNLAKAKQRLAHVLEQYADNRLIRPRAEYLGEKDVAYVPIDRRARAAS